MPLLPPMYEILKQRLKDQPQQDPNRDELVDEYLRSIGIASGPRQGGQIVDSNTGQTGEAVAYAPRYVPDPQQPISEPPAQEFYQAENYEEPPSNTQAPVYQRPESSQGAPVYQGVPQGPRQASTEQAFVPVRQVSPEVSGYSTPSFTTIRSVPQPVSVRTIPSDSQGTPVVEGQGIPGPAVNSNIVTPAQQRQMTDTAAFTPKTHAWTKAGPKDKVGTVEWQDTKRGINMETTVVKQPDGTLKKQVKEVSKMLTPAEVKAQLDALDNQVQGDGATGEPPAGLPASDSTAAPIVNPAVRAREAAAKAAEIEKQLNTPRTSPRLVPSPNSRVPKASVPQSSVMPAHLPPSAEILKQKAQTPKLRYSNTMASLGDVRAVSDDEKGSVYEVEFKPGVWAKTRVVDNTPQVFVGNEWKNLSVNSQVGKAVLDSPLIKNAGEPQTDAEEMDEDGTRYFKYKLGADGRPFNLTRPGMAIAPTDESAELLIDDDGNATLLDSNGIMTPITDWRALAGQPEMKKLWKHRYNELYKDYTLLTKPDGSIAPASFNESVAAFANSLSPTTANDTAVFTGIANRRGGVSENLEDGMTKALIDAWKVDIQNQQDSEEQSLKTGKSLDEVKDGRAKFYNEMLSNAISVGKKYLLSVGQDPNTKAGRKFIQSLFDRTLGTALKGSSSSGQQMSTSQELSAQKSGEVTRRSPMQILQLATETAKRIVANNKKHITVGFSENTGGVDQAAVLNDTLAEWGQTYPDLVLNGTVALEDVKLLNPYTIMAELEKAKADPEGRSALEAKINKFYSELDKYIVVDKLRPKPIQLHETVSDIANLSQTGVSHNEASKVDTKVAAVDKESSGVRSGGGRAEGPTYKIPSDQNKDRKLPELVAMLQQASAAVGVPDQKADVEALGAQVFGSPEAAKAEAIKNSTVIYDYMKKEFSDMAKLKKFTETIVERILLFEGQALANNSVTGRTIKDYIERVGNLLGLTEEYKTKEGESKHIILDHLKAEVVTDPKTQKQEIKNPSALVDPGRIKTLVQRAHTTKESSEGGAWKNTPGYDGNIPNELYPAGDIRYIASELAGGNIHESIKTRSTLGLLTPLVDDILAKGLIKDKDIHHARLKAQMGLSRRAQTAFQ